MSAKMSSRERSGVAQRIHDRQERSNHKEHDLAGCDELDFHTTLFQWEEFNASFIK
jgi:hypothetical protein